MSHNPGDLATSVPSPLGGVVRAALAPEPRGDDPPAMSSAEQAPRATRRGSDFAELCRLIRREGLLDRRPRYYVIKFAVVGALLAAGWAAFFVIGNSWWQLALAVYLALMFAQVGFVGHEAGHRQIFRSRRANAIVGLVGGNLLIGLSHGWWVGKHNRHHSHPNQLGKDPDINIAVIAFTPEQAQERRGLLRLMARYQAYFFFPLLLLEAVSIHVISARAVLLGPVRRRWLEGPLLLAHAVLYVTAVLLVLPPLRALAFIAVQQGLLGLYLGCAFAPNHKGMLVMSEHEKLDFFRRQVLTSRNVSGGPVVETLLGGLNYQIEHHLFPAMPRPSLRRCRTLVRAFCTQTGVLYSEKGLVGSYGDVLRTLHAAGR
ncbi:MAG TPA: acyl-CoA desaturase [Streptosporangiaceae bacterium]|nr:acyl-CoA desaturase [Streptosporangiaceae bacterium]